jgi:hypothetical protein
MHWQNSITGVLGCWLLRRHQRGCCAPDEVSMLAANSHKLLLLLQ